MRTLPRKPNQFEISENKIPGLSGMKVGQRFRGIMNFTCVEKTKSYTMVRIGFVSIIQSKRAF